MSSELTVGFAQAKPESCGGPGGAIISVQAFGLSGYWQFCGVTAPDSIVSLIRTMEMWSDLANQDLGVSAADEELGSFGPLEGGFELVLLSTPKGFAIEAREDDRHLDLRHHTRILVSAAEIARFVNGIFACSSGDHFSVTIRGADDLTEVTPQSVPMIRIFSGGLVDLRNQPGQLVGLALNLGDLRFVQALLRTLSTSLTTADNWSTPRQETHWCPSGTLLLDTKIITDAESLRRYLDFTIGTSETGSLWTIPRGQAEVIQSMNSLESDLESITFYGRFIPAFSYL